MSAMEDDLIKRIADSGLPVHNVSGLPVFYNDGKDDLLICNKIYKKRCKAIVISVPRSGTHFTSKLLERLGLVYVGIHASPKLETDVVEDRRCLKLDGNGRPYWQEYRLAVADVFRLIGPGQFIQGHVPYTDLNDAALADFKIVLIKRNLRDVAVSSMRFISSLKAKGMQFHASLDAQWCSMADGPDKMLAYLKSFGGGLKGYVNKILPWETRPNVLVLDFDVLNGQDHTAADACVADLANFLGAPISMEKAKAIRKAATGRGTVTWTGKLSRWEALWNDELERTFYDIVMAPERIATPADDADALRDDRHVPNEAAPAVIQAAPAGTIAWLRQGEVFRTALWAETDQPRAGLVAEICADRLLARGNARRLNLDLSVQQFLTDGVQTTLLDGSIIISSVVGRNGHKHLTIPIKAEESGISTLQVFQKTDQGSHPFMLQMGNENGFFNSFVDCRNRQISNMVSHGGSVSLCTWIERAANGDIGVSLSGMLGPGARSYARIYLCDDDGGLEFTHQVVLPPVRFSLSYGSFFPGAA